MVSAFRRKRVRRVDKGRLIWSMLAPGWLADAWLKDWCLGAPL